MKIKAKIKGAGIKGLTLAYFLKKQGVPSVIYEKDSHAGGWIETLDCDGFLFETGPRSFRGHPLILEMIQDLGISEELIRPNVKKRYIYTNGKLVSTSSFWPQIAAGLARDFTLPKCFEEMTVKDYFTYRLGQSCTKWLIDPLCSGIFAGDISRLSAQGCFPSMTKKGSVFKSMRGQPKMSIFSFKKGMATLVKALVKDQEIVYNETIESPDYDCSPNSAYEYVSVVSINLGWKDPVLRLSGFGYLVPSHEKQGILGVVFNSDRCLTVMMGGANGPDLIDSSDSKLLDIALTSLQRHLGIQKAADAVYIHRAYNAIPQPLVGRPVKGIGINGSILHAYEMSLQK